MQKLFSMLRQFSKPRGKTLADDEPYIYRSRGLLDTVLVVVIGVEAKLVPEIIETIKKKFPKADKLVFLTDDSDFTAFREQAVAFEYMPPLVEQRVHAADMPWQSYLRERWGLLLAKWKPRLILSYGMNIDAFLAAAPTSIPPRT
ncbi:hypothetical protein ACFSOZ_33910 [Mesorhizobium newzealandense]|uniref:Uncharacterized protein n=1 Tax=Mesorhizobium newzealandense TaxID=1300302 RepID=A0ABW4UPA9_9HYPH